MANCSDNTYVIKYTDSEKGTITIGKSALITDELDIALVGKTRLEYGQIFNENVLHLLEKFACPEDGDNPGWPDFDVAYGEILERPVEGQLWHNSTDNRPYVYNGTEWLPLGTLDDVGGNHGVILHGEQLPRPVSPISGYQFEYYECSWTVSPFHMEGNIDFMRCYTDALTSEVTMEYRVAGESNMTPGYVNYQIIGIRGNNNLGISILPDPPLTPSPVAITPTPSITPSITPSPGSSPTPTPTPTVTPTPSPITSFMASVFRFNNEDIEAYSVNELGATLVDSWDYSTDNPSDSDTTPRGMFVTQSGATRYIGALYNKYFRVLSWDGATLTQVAKVALAAKTYLNGVWSSETNATLPTNLVNYYTGLVSGHTAVKAIDYGTYIVFFVGDVGSVSVAEGGNTRTYECPLQTFKFVKSGSVLTNNTSSILPRFNTTEPIYSRSVDSFDIISSGSNIRVATANNDMDMIFQYNGSDTNTGNYTSTIRQASDGTNNNVPSGPVVWADANGFIRGKTRDSSDEGYNDFVKWHPYTESDSIDIDAYGIGVSNEWAGATTSNIFIADRLSGMTISDRILALPKSVSSSDYDDDTIINAQTSILQWTGTAIFSLNRVKLSTKSGVDYLLFKVTKLPIQDGSTVGTTLVIYSFDAGTFTHEVSLNWNSTDYDFYVI